MALRRCYGCMDMTDQPVCPRCGCGVDVANQPHQLPPGTILGGRFLVGRALWQSPQAIGYIALDRSREQTVNVLEFYPMQHSRRKGNAVEPAGGSAGRRFAEAKGMFIRACQAMAGDRELAAVTGTLEAFEENGTTYLISERVRGTTLDQYVRVRGGALGAEETLGLLGPVLRAVAAAHRMGVSHGGIRIGAIALNPTGGAMLQGFGENPGFCPQEDVLALCRVILGCLMEGGEHCAVCPEYVPGLTAGQIAALKKGMAAAPGDRFASAGELYAALNGVPTAGGSTYSAPQPVYAPPQPEQPKKSHKKLWIGIGAGAAAALLVAAVVLFFTVHIWKDADCTHPETCAICGKTRGEDLGHDWQEADCESPMICSRCGELDGQILGHDWAEATCEEPKTCSRCGNTSGEPLGHDWLEATVLEPMTCRRCGATHGTPKGYRESVSGTYERFYSTKVNGWCLKLDEPVLGCRKFTLVVDVSDIDYGDPAGSWKAFYRNTKGEWVDLGNFTMTGTSASATFSFDTPVNIDSVTAVYDGGGAFSYIVSFAVVDVYAEG